MITVADLAVGERGIIEQVNGDDSITLRILEMGATPGSELSIVGSAPLGDPIEIEIRDYRLSLRKAEAERIQLKPRS